jgi:hypothetical protein
LRHHDSSRPPLTADDIQWDLVPPDDCPPDDDLLVVAVLDAEVYRLMAQAAIGALRELSLKYSRQREHYYHMLRELRELRASRRHA